MSLISRPLLHKKLDSILLYCQKHPHSTTRLCIQSPPHFLLSGLDTVGGNSQDEGELPGLDLSALPLPNLRELDLSGLHISFGPQQQQQVSLLPQQLSSLQQVELSFCTIEGGPDGLSAVVQLPALQSLELDHLFDPRDMPGSPLFKSKHITIPATSLEKLEGVTRLALNEGFGYEHLAAITALTKLQQLRLVTHNELQFPQQWQPPQLTYLDLSCPALTIDSAAHPVMQLTGLKELKLGCRLTAAAMAGHTQLQCLKLPELSFPDPLNLLGTASIYENALFPGVRPDGAAAAAAWRAASDGLSPSFGALLTWVGQLRHLTSLQVKLSIMSSRHFCCNVPAAACSALTASSNLRELVLLDIWWPEAGWEHILSESRQLPQLTRLALGWPKLGQESYRSPPPQRLQQIASCCPAVQDLSLGLTLAGDDQVDSVAALQQLTALVRLQVCCLSNDTAAALGSGLSSIASLNFLMIINTDHPLSTLNHHGLLHLTVLQQLLMLAVRIQEAQPKKTMWDLPSYGTLSLTLKQSYQMRV